MIVLNGVVGLCLLFGGLRHHEQAYNLQGAVAYLAVIIPLSVIALVLPNFTKAVPPAVLRLCRRLSSRCLPFLSTGFSSRSRPDATGISLSQTPTQKERLHPWERLVDAARGLARRWHTLLLVVTMLPIVLLAKQLAKLIDHGIAVLGAPAALGGVLIAVIVFTPEAISALRAALDNQLQRRSTCVSEPPRRPSVSRCPRYSASGSRQARPWSWVLIRPA